MIPHSEFEHLKGEERIKAENEFNKMKLMLEKGAEFHSTPGEEVNPFVEHQMLNYVMEFEKQAENSKFITVFDKLKRPTHFKPVASIPDEEMPKAWEELSKYMEGCDVYLDVCSPNISEKELYRFTIEELFGLQINDISIPGMKCMFIYDEFYPDPVYDNSRTAMNDGIRYILSKNPIEWMYNFLDCDLQLNEYMFLSVDSFKQKVNQYKGGYDEIDIREIKVRQCTVDGSRSIVEGDYMLILYLGGEAIDRKGNWTIELQLNSDFGYWYINRVEIEGIAF